MTSTWTSTAQTYSTQVLPTHSPEFQSAPNPTAAPDSYIFVVAEQVPLAELMNGQFPDWFPDPSSEVLERFWDGSRWTNRTRVAIPAALAGPTSNHFDTSTMLRLSDFLQPIEPTLLAIIENTPAA